MIDLDDFDDDIECLAADIDWDELGEIFGGDYQLIELANELLKSPPKTDMGEIDRIRNMAIPLDEWEVYL
jgi:hypothetical protein